MTRMSIAETFLPEFDAEMASTRRLLERVPADRLDWKPHAKSRSLGELATHVDGAAPLGHAVRDATSFRSAARRRPSLKTAAELPRALRRERRRQPRQHRANARRGDGGGVHGPEAQRRGLLQGPERAVLRRVLLNHLIHHRGQLTVYLRLNDVPLPPLRPDRRRGI